MNTKKFFKSMVVAMIFGTFLFQMPMANAVVNTDGPKCTYCALYGSPTGKCNCNNNGNDQCAFATHGAAHANCSHTETCATS